MLPLYFNAFMTARFFFYSEMNSDGKILVICCEGNAGFYEVGMISTPLELGYSVLGWNHPGFGGSTVSLKYFSVLISNSAILETHAFDVHLAGSTLPTRGIKCR